MGYSNVGFSSGRDRNWPLGYGQPLLSGERKKNKSRLYKYVFSLLSSQGQVGFLLLECGGWKKSWMDKIGKKTCFTLKI